MAAPSSGGCDDGTVIAAHVDGHVDRRAVASSSESAATTGKGRLYVALKISRATAALVVEGLVAAMDMEVEVDPAAFGGRVIYLRPPAGLYALTPSSLPQSVT